LFNQPILIESSQVRAAVLFISWMAFQSFNQQVNAIIIKLKNESYYTVFKKFYQVCRWNLLVDEESEADSNPCEIHGHKHHKTTCFSAIKKPQNTNATKKTKYVTSIWFSYLQNSQKKKQNQVNKVKTPKAKQLPLKKSADLTTGFCAYWAHLALDALPFQLPNGSCQFIWKLQTTWMTCTLAYTIQQIFINKISSRATLCWARYMLSQFRLSVCLTVTRVLLYQNGWTYHQYSFAGW